MAAYHTSLDLQTFWIEMFKYLIASFIVRGSACTINDIFDRNFDAGVGEPVSRYTASFPPHHVTERTKGCPLASGRVSAFATVVGIVAQWSFLSNHLRCTRTTTSLAASFPETGTVRVTTHPPHLSFSYSLLARR